MFSSLHRRFYLLNAKPQNIQILTLCVSIPECSTHLDTACEKKCYANDFDILGDALEERSHRLPRTAVDCCDHPGAFRRVGRIPVVDLLDWFCCFQFPRRLGDGGDICNQCDLEVSVRPHISYGRINACITRQGRRHGDGGDRGL